QAILHGMTDEQVVQLLHTIRQAMRENGTVLQVDMVVPEGNEPSTSKFGNVHMMIFTPSHERSEAEYRALYERAGFQLTRVLPTSSVFTILEGKQL
ncbi:MAG TPA: methyltransferase, partial [Roseiflexaceae bacterium]|nr:methyltransferase [Roseiflexaceae bacterium]